MKINKLLGLAVALAAVSSLSAAAAIDADIAGKNGLALKQYAQVLKNRAGLPHHAALSAAGAYDTEKLIESVGIVNMPAYVAAELPKLKVRAKAYLDECMTGHAAIGDQFLLAAVEGGTQPANTTYGAFITAFNTELDRVITAVAIAENGPATAKLSLLVDAQERFDAKVQAAIIPWVTALHAGGLGQNVLHANCQADGADANGAGIANAPAGITVADLLLGLQEALIVH